MVCNKPIMDEKEEEQIFRGGSHHLPTPYFFMYPIVVLALDSQEICCTPGDAFR